MPTPRSESIYKAVHATTEIRPPVERNDIENKIDHYAVLSQVINEGVTRYIHEPQADSKLATATSTYDLEGILRGEVSDSILNTLTSDAFRAHFDSLHSSQTQRHMMDSSRWNDVALNILAGTTTFVHSFSHIHSMLQRHLGEAVASNPDNWRIADRIAKLEIHQFSAYYNTYLTTFQNWSAMMEHFEITETRGVQFKAGYPGDALVPLPVTEQRPILENKDFALDGSQPLLAIKDMDTSQAIGCPVTFTPDTVKNLWGLYVQHAHRILTTPAVASSGDIEASSR